MKKTARIFLASVVFLAALGSECPAQDLQSAYFIDNYTYSYRLNPAFTTKKNFIGGIVSNLNSGINSNVGLSTFFYPRDGKLATFMHPSVDRDEFLGKLHNTNKIGINVTYNLASTGIWTKIKDKDVFQTFEISFRNNTSAKIPYGLFDFMKGGGESFIYDLSHVYGYTRSFLEFAGGASVKFDKLSVGARAKFLLGTNKINMKVHKMVAQLDGTSWAIESYGYLSAAGGGIKNKTKPGAISPDYDALDWDGVKFRPFGIGGIGGAIDIGARYEINEYINVSASVNDLGFIVWRNKVNAVNAGNTYIIQIDDIDSEEGSIFDVVNNVINKFKSVYEFLPEKKDFTTQSLSLNVNLGAEFKMPFYKKMSIGILGSTRNSHINRYNEVRMSLNAAPLKWLSFSVNTAYTSYGWEIGGMVNVYAKKFSAYLGTDSYYFNMNRQFIPLYEANAHVVVGVNYLLSHNPYKKRR